MRWSREHRAHSLLAVLLLMGPAYGCGDRPALGDGGSAKQAGAQPREGDDVCARATQHVFGLIEGTGPVEGPERLVMEGLVAKARGECRKEGLSSAQAQCIFAVEDPAALSRLRECEAIAAQTPSWLSLPPPAALDPSQPGSPP